MHKRDNSHNRRREKRRHAEPSLRRHLIREPGRYLHEESRSGKLAPVAVESETSLFHSSGVVKTLRLSLLTLLLLALLPQRIYCQSSDSGGGNDPSHLCASSDGSVKHSGYMATRDCRGYVFCSDGYLMGGGEAVTNAVTGSVVQPGVIPCWPNQLYDAALGVCTYWQDVDTSNGNCPEFDGNMMMPDLTDGNANEDLFFCGASAFNARTVCEPCPGGSRLECTDVTHNCFAGITGCSIANTDPSIDYSASTDTLPSFSTEVIVVQSAEPTSQDGVAAPSRTPSGSEEALVVQSAEPTVASDVGEGMNIAMYQNPSGNSFFCGESYDKISEQCFMSKPCPSGVGADYCADHGGCFSVPSCTEKYESAADANGPISRVTSNPSKQPVTIPTPDDVVTFQDPTSASPTSQTEIAVEESLTQSTASPLNAPTTSSPSKVPTVNTNFCGITWDDHTRNCASSTPCPLGDECPPGEQCFTISPCATLNNQEDVDIESNVGSFCSTEWNLLLSTCETATRCPDGDECADDEFCFIDFVCDPMQISTNNPISSTVNPHDSATSQPGNGCELCGARIDGPRYDIRRNMTVDVYGHEISCADLSIKILLMYGPASDQCLEIVGTHSIHCCFEKCMLCGDYWEDTVYFPGEEAICHELDSKVFVEEEVAYDSERCKTSQSFYSETCCIQTPDKPCDLCTLNGVNFYMKSDVKVSYKGEVQTCLQLYHFLYSRREETSRDCINAQVESFEQCCEAKSTPIPVDIVDESAPPSPAGVSKVPNAWTAPISPEFDSWYAGPLLSSASSSTASMCFLLLPITVWLC